MTATQDAPALVSKGLGLLRHSGQEPIRTVAAKGQPYLLLGMTSHYSWLYSDSGSGAHRDVTLWRPEPTDTGYYIIGDYAQGNYGNPTGPTVIVTAVNDADNTLLKPPVDYREVWNDHGSGGHHDGSVWYPVPPDNFVSLGFVGQRGYGKPSIANYRCVHHSQLVNAQVGPSIWSDRGSGAHHDVTLYAVPTVPGTFVAQSDYSPYAGAVYQFKIQ